MKSWLLVLSVSLLQHTLLSAQCEAGFTWEQIPGTLTIHFNNTSTSEHDIISYLWNFGDGHMGDGQNPNHTYEEPGVYNVCLVIQDSEGCIEDVCHEVVVEGIASECDAEFEWEQIPGTLNIHFFSTSTSSHEIVNYQWNFGDGHIGDNNNDPYHEYEEPGVYVVCLIITNEAGCVSDVCHEVVVEGVGSGCEAEFEWEQIPGSLQVHFISTSESSSGIVSYQWNFGDGHMGDGNDPYHTYEEPGVYLVCLIITNETGCVSDVCHEVVVEGPQPPQAGYSYHYENGSSAIYFENHSSGATPSTVWSWDFGDGSSSSEENPVHRFTRSGVFQVCLTMYDSLTASSSTYCLRVLFRRDAKDHAKGNGIAPPAHLIDGPGDTFTLPEWTLKYNNPVRDLLRIEIGHPGSACLVELTDLSGNRIFFQDLENATQPVHQLQFETGHLVPGIYILRIVGEGQCVTRQVLIAE